MSVKKEAAEALLEKLDSGGIAEEELDLLLALHLDVGQAGGLERIKKTGGYEDSYLDARLAVVRRKYGTACLDAHPKV